MDHDPDVDNNPSNDMPVNSGVLTQILINTFQLNIPPLINAVLAVLAVLLLLSM